MRHVLLPLIVTMVAKLTMADTTSVWSGYFSVDCRNGSDFAWSDYFETDTRDADSSLAVKAIRGRYFSDNKTAYFLPGLPVKERIDATVDWHGEPAGTVLFKHGVTVFQNGSSSVADCDMGALAPGELIQVQARSADGRNVSAWRTANLVVMPFPGVLSALGSTASLLDTVSRGDTVEYKLKAEAKRMFWSEDLSSVPTDDAGNAIPGCTGNPLKWDVTVGFTGSIKSDGSLGFTVSRQRTGDGGIAGLDYWNLLGLKIYPKYAFGLHGQYHGAQGWSYGGHGSISVSGKMDIPSLCIPPIFSKAYVQAEMSAEGDITRHPSCDDIQWKLSLPGEVIVGLVGGLGVDGVAAVEVFGGGGPYWDLQLAPDPQLEKYGITFEYGGRVVTLLGEKSLAAQHYVDLKEVLQLGGPLALAKAKFAAERALRAELGAALAAPQRDAGFRLMPRRGGSSAKSSALSMNALGLAADAGAGAWETPLGVGETVLQTNGFAFSQPSLVVTGNVPTVFWLRDNTARSDENRTELVMQGFNATGAWSSAAAVWDDGTADFAPAAAAVTNGLLAAWQNTGSALPSGATLADMFAAQEIGVASLTSAGISVQNLTQNGWLDHSSKLSARNGTALLAWVSNPSNSPSGSAAEPNAIQWSRWDGSSWSAPATVAGGVGTLLWMTLGYNGSEGRLVACLDTDEDRATVADQEIYGAVFNGASWGALTRLTADAVQDANPQIAVGPSGGFTLTWFKGGSLMTATLANLGDAVSAGGMEESSSAADYRLLAGPNGELAAVWQSLGADGQAEPAALYYDRFQTRWSAPVKLLTNSNRMERSIAGAFGADGALRLAYNSVHVTGDAQGRPAVGDVDLCALTYQPVTDLAVVDGAITLAPETFAVGDSVTARITVANLGSVAATNVAVAFFDGVPGQGGVAIGGTNVAAAVLAGGATATVSVAWTAPCSVVQRTLYAVVDPESKVVDANRSNNTASRNALRGGLALEAMHSEFSAGTERIVYARVHNTGQLAVSNTVTVVFRDGANPGAVVGACSVFPVAPGSEYEAALVWDVGVLAATSAYTTVWATVDEQGLVDDADRSDNEGTALVMTALDSDGDGIPDGREYLLGTDPGKSDTDEDGISDGDELNLYRTDPLNKDTDGDGMKDGDEVKAGTGPQDRDSLLRILSVGNTATGGTVTLTFQSVAGKRYILVRAAALGGAWESVGEAFDAVSDQVELSVPKAAGADAAFYRIQLAE